MSTLLSDADNRCDEKCYDAAGAECNCICGGANHGVGYESAARQSSIFSAHVTISKAKFYEDERRARSREIDFGVWWRDGSNLPTYRVSWIETTGEIYAIEQGTKNAHVEILGVITNETEVESRLEGWTQACGRINSLSWVRRRI